MGFRENLKLELHFHGMLVKELAAAAGVHKRAIDTYLISENPSMPPADTAVKIAKALGVSVEYLVTGEDPNISNDMRQMIRRFRQLNLKDREIVAILIDAMLKRQGK